MSDVDLTIKPDDVSFDPFGRVIIKNPEFVSVLENLADGALLSAESNSGGCGNNGCGNTGNAGGCGTANGSCSSLSELEYDDWTIFDNGAIIKNALFAQGMLDVKMGGKLEVPIKLKVL